MPVHINGLEVFDTVELDGAGSVSIHDYRSILDLVSEPGRTYPSVMEWCSGPGYWGFLLLESTYGVNSLVLSDVYQPAIDIVNKTIEHNGLQDCVKAHCSFNFNDIPKQKFDLIVGNPPWFCIDPFSKFYYDERLYKDEDWKAHKDFFAKAGQYLNDNGRIILNEHVYGSGPKLFEKMLEETDLKIEHSIRSKVFREEGWYLVVQKKNNNG